MALIKPDVENPPDIPPLEDDLGININATMRQNGLLAKLYKVSLEVTPDLLLPLIVVV